MYTLRIEQDLNIGRELRLPYDTENKSYGLRWKVIVSIKTGTFNTWGVAVDFSHVRNLIKRHDNQFFTQRGTKEELKQFPGGYIECPFPPTMENIAKFLWEEISLYLAKSPHYKESAIDIVSVEIQGDGGSVCYTP